MVVPYRGKVYSVLGNMSYALNDKTDLRASYTFSRADYRQQNDAAGLPLGIVYRQHGATASLTRRLLKNMSGTVQYGFFYYTEPTSGGANNYKAHADMANMLAADYASTANPSDISTAEEHTDLLLKKQPNDPDSHIAAANLLNAERKFLEAIAEIQKAIALAPTRGDSYLNLALLQTRIGQFDAAEANYKKAIDLNAQGENGHMALAAFYQNRGRYAEAEQQVQSVIASDPKDVNARTSLAKLYKASGLKRNNFSPRPNVISRKIPSPTGYSGTTILRKAISIRPRQSTDHSTRNIPRTRQSQEITFSC